MSIPIVTDVLMTVTTSELFLLVIDFDIHQGNNKIVHKVTYTYMLFMNVVFGKVCNCLTDFANINYAN